MELKRFINLEVFHYLMKRGRPTKSAIRQNMVDLLYHLKEAYGYNIYKEYTKIFPKVTMRVIYYHLKKGCDLEEFKVNKVEREKGDFSWGSEAEKIYYSLGSNANPSANERVKASFDQRAMVSKSNSELLEKSK